MKCKLLININAFYLLLDHTVQQYYQLIPNQFQYNPYQNIQNVQTQYSNQNRINKWNVQGNKYEYSDNDPEECFCDDCVNLKLFCQNVCSNCLPHQLPPVMSPMTPSYFYFQFPYPYFIIPNVTAPSVTDPSVTVPSVTALSVTAPSVTVPSVTALSVTAPSVTAPSVTAPSVTAPSVTAPSVTATSVTVPSSTTYRWSTTEEIATSENTIPSSSIEEELEGEATATTLITTLKTTTTTRKKTSTTTSTTTTQASTIPFFTETESGIDSIFTPYIERMPMYMYMRKKDKIPYMPISLRRTKPNWTPKYGRAPISGQFAEKLIPQMRNMRMLHSRRNNLRNVARIMP